MADNESRQELVNLRHENQQLKARVRTLTDTLSVLERPINRRRGFVLTVIVLAVSLAGCVGAFRHEQPEVGAALVVACLAALLYTPVYMID